MFSDSTPLPGQNQTPPQVLAHAARNKHALDTLPGRMEKLQAEIDGHQAALADPDLFKSNPGQFDTVAKALQMAETALAEAEEQWLELEMRREALESG